MNRPADLDTALRAAARDVHAAVAAVPLTSPPVTRRPRPLLAAVAVAAAVAVVLVGLNASLGGSPRTAPPPAATTPAPAPTVTTAVRPTVSPAQAPVCGEDLPVRIYPPKGWKGPQPGPAAQSTSVPEPGQRVVHWTGADGSFEVRWPSSVTGAVAYDPNESMTVRGDGDGATLDLPVRGDLPCTRLAAQWFGGVPKGFGSSVGAGLSDVDRALFAIVTAPKDLRLVRTTTNASAAPTTVRPCDGGNVPDRGGTVTTAAQPSPEQALQAFLDGGSDAVRGMNRSGWTKFVLPQGGAAFGVPLEGGPGWVQLVYLTRSSDGWSVTRWRTSGC